jgi:proteasome lid subunit RPN8/RPN11
LRFSPTAWAKLLYFRDKTANEVGGFGVTPSDDLLYVQDFVTVKQQVTCISIDFDDAAVGDFFEDQVDQGRRPEQFARLWVHTHPGDSPQPSGVDEATFERVFGQCDWSVMFIMARNGTTYARISFNVGPGGQVLIPTEVDFSRTFEASNQEQWDLEYEANIFPEPSMGFLDSPMGGHAFWDQFNEDSVDLLGSLEHMDQLERQGFWDELASRPDIWAEESEVMSL